MTEKKKTKPKKTESSKPKKAERKPRKTAEKPVPVHTLLLRFLPALIPGAAAFILLKYSESHRDFSEWFALHVQPLWQGSMGRLTSLFPFSVNEIVIYLALLAAVFFLTRDIIRLFRGTAKQLWLYRWLRDAVLIGGILFLMSTVGSGVNFSRYTFAEKTGLSTAGGTVDELEALCREMVAGVNRCVDLVERDEDGCCVVADTLGKDAAAAMKKLAETYDFLDVYYPRPKAILWSEFMSHANFTGIYSPFTGESQYNDNAPDYGKPHTVCHELGHAAGFEREDEANFIGFLACLASDDPTFAYSGYLLGYIYATNALYGADHDSFHNITFFYNAARRCIFNGSNDDIADPCISPGRAAHNTDAKQFFGTGVISDFKSGFLLYHADIPPILFRSLDDLDKSPSLILGEGSRLHHLYGITDAAFVVLIMGFQLIGSLYDLFVKRMFHMILNRYNNGLVHFIADDLAGTCFSKISFHGNSPFLCRH